MEFRQGRQQQGTRHPRLELNSMPHTPKKVGGGGSWEMENYPWKQQEQGGLGLCQLNRILAEGSPRGSDGTQ